MATMDDLDRRNTHREWAKAHHPRWAHSRSWGKTTSPPPPPPPSPFTDLDGRVPHPVRHPAYEPWAETLNNAKDEFEVDGGAAVFSTSRIEGEDPLDIGDVKIADGMHARADRLALDARMSDVRAIQLLAALPGGHGVSPANQVSPGESWRCLGPWRQVWSSPGWAKKGSGGRRGRSEHKPWVIDWNRQCVLSEHLPLHRSCLRPLPRQGSIGGGGGGWGGAKPCERSSSSIPEAPSSSPQPITWPKKCGPGASRPRPITASSTGVARRTWCLKGRDSNLFHMWSSGTRSAQCPAPLCKPSSTGSRDGASRTSFCCGDQGQPPQIAGEMPHNWLCGHAAYFEEVEVDHRAKRKCRPGASRPRPITASSDGAAKRTGRLKGWDRNLFPVWSSGTGSAQCPAPLCKPSSTGSRDGVSRTSAVVIRGSPPPPPPPNHWRNATRLAPGACRLLRRGWGRPQSQKRSRSESTFSPTGSSAERCERPLPGCLGWERFVEAWKPCDLRPGGRRFATGPRGFCPRAMRSISRTPPCLCYIVSRILSGKTSWSPSLGPCWMAGKTSKSSRCPWNMPARSSTASGARSGLLATPSRSLEPGSHSCQSSESLDHRQLSPVAHLAYLAVSRVEYLSKLERVVCPPPTPQRAALRVHAHSPSSSSAKSSRGSWWTISDRAKPRVSGLAWRLITS